MRKRIFLAVGLVGILATGAEAGPDICGCWTPQSGQIANMEKQLRNDNQLRGKLGDYARYYAGGINEDRKFIRGQLVPLAPGEMSAVHVVTGHVMTPMQGLGCITGYDIKSAKVLYVSCASPGAWTPTDAQIAAMEQSVQLPMGIVPLALYARYYAGITISGRKLIEAVYLHDYEAPGIYVASEAELPILGEGGCLVMTLRYDPATRQTLELECAEGG
jgi:hypothetical protein